MYYNYINESLDKQPFCFACLLRDSTNKPKQSQSNTSSSASLTCFHQMASYVRFSTTIFFCFFLSLSSSQKVTLSLYYEALCPFCADFIVNHLPQIFQNGLISSIDLHLVPWGNTLFQPDGTILCQVFSILSCIVLLVYKVRMQHLINALCFSSTGKLNVRSMLFMPVQLTHTLML